MEACSTRESFYRERFLSCFNDKAFCSREGGCEAFCAGWMGCSGALAINSAGVGTVTNTEPVSAVCSGTPSSGGGGGSTGGGSGSTGGGGGAAVVDAGPSAACLALNGADASVSEQTPRVTVGGAFAAGERIGLTYDYLGTSTDTPYVLTAYWSDGTDAGVDDAGSPRVILWEQKLDGQKMVTAPSDASGITFTCAFDCHLGWNVALTCAAP